MANTPKPIEIVNGDGKDLEISPIYDHISVGKPKPKEEQKKQIVIPKEKIKKTK